MPKYGLIACFNPVMTARQLATLAKLSWMVPKGKNRDLENGKKKCRVLVIQKVAKTGNIGAKKSPVAGDINYVRYLSMQKVNTDLNKLNS